MEVSFDSPLRSRFVPRFDRFCSSKSNITSSWIQTYFSHLRLHDKPFFLAFEKLRIQQSPTAAHFSQRGRPHLSPKRTLNMIRKCEMLSSSSLESFVSPSDTAWTAMVPHPERSDLPMFPTCLEWVLHNQRQGGSWGEPGRRPTIHSLTETLACMVALKVWKVGATNVHKGLDFIHANTEKLLVIKRHDDGGHPLRWFAIVFPGMIELAVANGLDVFPGGFPEVVRDIFVERQKILETWEEEQLSQKGYHPPLETYLEALPITSFEVERVLKEYQSQDGSLFQSPSATARAYIISGDDRCMHYLQSMVRRCAHGAVPHVYPVDEELVKLCVVDHLERLGLADHFADDIEHALHEVYRFTHTRAAIFYLFIYC
ncbi:S-linalool synthase [Acorus calamus]|uniref:S-linalool synthase n=1 Tax=Acorus calamus TaxID=4465 RepID=A0AAV9C802_ACOCL|nr:S-linalool synthase [Acorus calamus]